MSHSSSLITAVLAAVWLAVTPWCGAHPVSVTRAHVYVTRDRATAEVEVFLEDLFLFHQLQPNERDFLELSVIQQGIHLHRRFIAERFVIRNAAGEPLRPEKVELAEVELPSEGVPLAELMAHRLTFELRYRFATRPEFLTFSQQFTDETTLFPAEMRLFVKQQHASDVQAFELRPGDVQHVRFPWNRPPLSPAASEAEREEFLAQEQAETLGISSYSSVYSFLYIEDREVRHEILIPLLTLNESISLVRGEDDFLDVDEQDAVRDAIEEYFIAGNPIEVDGIAIRPRVQRCDFYGLDFKDFAQLASRQRVPLVSARVGIILAYTPASAPSTVKLTWNRFNRFAWTVNTVVFAEDETRRATLTRLGKNNVLQWQRRRPRAATTLAAVPAVFPERPLRSVPTLSWACLLVSAGLLLTKRCRLTRSGMLFVVGLLLAAVVGRPYMVLKVPQPWPRRIEIAESEADAIFASLHQNTYGAFAVGSEEQIYDALALSVHGELLRDLYLQIRRGLVMREQGGALTRVRKVWIVSGQPEPLATRVSAAPKRAGFSYRCRWNVAGTVEHWGHVHERTNQYEALFSVQPVAGFWKLTGLELLDQERLKFETRLRGL